MGGSDVSEDLAPYLKPDAGVQILDGLAVAPIDFKNAYTRANAVYFDNHVWASEYFRACHRDDAFKDRWQAAIGSWNDKVIVDVGCGPGNLFATLGGKPKALIGVDVSKGALGMAKEIGYMPLQADAHNLPLVSEFADIVALNATLHHCDAMATVLREAARLVRPGGILICDHDPQLTARLGLAWSRDAALQDTFATLPALPGTCLGGTKASDGVGDTSQARAWRHVGFFPLALEAARF